MSRLKFYIEKTKFLAAFIWWREWSLVRCEWKRTYGQMQAVEVRSDELGQEAAERLLQYLKHRALV